MSNFKKAFGIKLKTLRKLNNITQEEFSEMIDIHPQQVSKIETGSYFPSSTTLEKICITLNISPKELFDFPINGIDIKTNNIKNNKLNKNADELLKQVKLLEEAIKKLKREINY